jgi:hypothetical protein
VAGNLQLARGLSCAAYTRRLRLSFSPSLSLYTHAEIWLIASSFSIILERDKDNHSNGILCSDGINIIHVRTLLFAFHLRDVLLLLICLVTKPFALKIKQLKAVKYFSSASLNIYHAENVSKKTVYI